MLKFTTQKNQQRGQQLAHARSGHALCCPVLAIAQMILHHRNNNNARPDTRLASYYAAGKCIPLRATAITSTIRLFAALCRNETGVAPDEYSARSLRAGGAMALLTGGCDDNIIKLLGRWRSDAMMEYLHQQSLPISKQLSTIMYNNGAHNFLPSEEVIQLS